MAKAKKIATFREQYFTTIEYEYRGHKYDVTYSNSWQACASPAWVQHRDEQAKIDKLIEMEENPKMQEPIDWDDIFKMIQGE